MCNGPQSQALQEIRDGNFTGSIIFGYVLVLGQRAQYIRLTRFEPVGLFPVSCSRRSASFAVRSIATAPERRITGRGHTARCEELPGAYRRREKSNSR